MKEFFCALNASKSYATEMVIQQHISVSTFYTFKGVQLDSCVFQFLLFIFPREFSWTVVSIFNLGLFYSKVCTMYVVWHSGHNLHFPQGSLSHSIM